MINYKYSNLDKFEFPHRHQYYLRFNMDISKLEKAVPIINKLIATLHPKFDVSKMTQIESTHWEHEYDFMIANGTLDKVCLVIFDKFPELRYVTDQHTYTGGHILIARKESSSIITTIAASSNKLSYIKQAETYSFRLDIEDLESIDTFSLSKLLDEARKINYNNLHPLNVHTDNIKKITSNYNFTVSEY